MTIQTKRPTKDELKRRADLINNQNGGIYPIYEALYLQAVIYSASRSEAAFKRFEKAVSSSTHDTLNMAAIQEALTHAAALSRFFSPQARNVLTDASYGQEWFMIETSVKAGRLIKTDASFPTFSLWGHIRSGEISPSTSTCCRLEPPSVMPAGFSRSSIRLVVLRIPAAGESRLLGVFFRDLAHLRLACFLRLTVGILPALMTFSLVLFLHDDISEQWKDCFAQTGQQRQSS
jgi:hypothetical protein